MSNELQTIPISSLYESPENSRHVFDERKLKELAQSIKAQGIKVPCDRAKKASWRL